jgi:hypothetical protein
MKAICNKTCCLLLLPALLLSGNALAERLYKWVDDDGQVHYSNRLPPEAAKRERKVINEQGRTLKVYRAPLTPEEKAEQARIEELEKKKRELAEKRAMHDRSLLATYSNTDDMHAAMEGKLSSVESLIKLTNSRINTQQNRLLELTEDAASYERSGKQLPDNLQRQISNLRDQITQNKAFIEDKKLEMEDIKLQYEYDVRRFTELTNPNANAAPAEEPKAASAGEPEIATVDKADAAPAIKAPRAIKPEAASELKAEVAPPEKAEPAPAEKVLTPLEVAKANPNIKLTQYDQILLATYASEEDLLFARDQEASNLNAAIEETATRLDTMQIERGEITDEIFEYQMKNEIPPDRLTERMEILILEIGDTQVLLDQQRNDKQELDENFANDISRYRKLTASN